MCSPPSGGLRDLGITEHPDSVHISSLQVFLPLTTPVGLFCTPQVTALGLRAEGDGGAQGEMEDRGGWKWEKGDRGGRIG